MRTPRFLTVEDTLLLHQLALLEFGGTPGVRDMGLLESAVAQPQAGISSGYLHKYPFEMAAAYGFHLARNHPFVDGNKRVAWAATRAFLFREGFQLRVAADGAVQMMLGVADGTSHKEQFSRWLQERAVPRPTMELRNFFLDLTFDELHDKLVAIADSYRSGGPSELTTIVNEAADAMPVLRSLAALYQHRRAENEQAIHYVQLLCALHRIAEENGYEW